LINKRLNNYIIMVIGIGETLSEDVVEKTSYFIAYLKAAGIFFTLYLIYLAWRTISMFLLKRRIKEIEEKIGSLERKSKKNKKENKKNNQKKKNKK